MRNGTLQRREKKSALLVQGNERFGQDRGRDGGRWRERGGERERLMD